MYVDDWMMEDSDWEYLDVNPSQQQDAAGSNASSVKEPGGEEEPERRPCWIDNNIIWIENNSAKAKATAKTKRESKAKAMPNAPSTAKAKGAPPVKAAPPPRRDETDVIYVDDTHYGDAITLHRYSRCPQLRRSDPRRLRPCGYCRGV